MKCFICGNELKSGKLENTSMEHMIGTFQEDGSTLRLRDIFKGNTVGTVFSSGQEIPAYYCEHCKKIIGVFDKD